MRTLLVDSGRTWRGGQQQVELLAAALAERGHDVQVLAPAGSVLARRTGFLSPSADRFRPRFDLDIVAAQSLRRACRTFGPSIVHAQDARGHAVARLAQALGMQARLVVTRRVTFAPKGRLKYRRGVARYIAISKAVGRALRRAGVSRERIDLIPSAIPPVAAGRDARERGALEPAGGGAVVLCLCALTPEKGVETIVRAAAIARRDGMPGRWVVAGEGPQRARLEALATEHRAPVTFAGFLPDVDAALRGAAVLVHTPTHEGLGTAILHAMQRGIPVVASRVGGIPEIVTPSVGSLVPPGDPAGVAAAVSRWLADPEGRQSVRREGPLIAGRYGVGRMVERTLRCYARAMC